ncbi:MAG: hypothetical protein GY698_07680 [Actinomycetia bacterium]|nr:hypothetical protein [Actinomycetes bacterium]
MVAVGSNSFLGVPFPLAIGDRYIHIGPDPEGGPSPIVRVFRWDATTSTVTEETETATGTPLTWSHDAGHGTIRLRVDPTNASMITGYAAGGPLDAITVVARADAIEVLEGDTPIVTVSNSMLSGFPVGLLVDPSTGGVSMGAPLPEGFHVSLRHTDEIVRIAMLVDPGMPVLRDREFIGCRIVGPALLAQGGPIQLVGCGFDMQGAQPDSLVWEVPSTGEAYGAIVLSDVSFERCEFVAVGLVAPPGQRETLLRSLAGDPQPDA